MTDLFALGEYLSRWIPGTRHNLTSSDCETLTLGTLLGMAGPDDLQRWNDLGLGYADHRGSHYLRVAIAARHSDLGADDILCCAGAHEALVCVAGALLGPDDHAVVVLPLYEPSERAVTSLCQASGVALQESDGWRLDVDRVRAALRPNTRMVLANFPNSPTGASLDRATMAALVDLCRRHGLWLVNDEVYRETDSATADRPPKVADCYERGISVSGLSKGFGLPGLRVGWAACRDRDMLARATAVKSLLSSCLASASEVLAHVALGAEDVIIRQRREIGRRNAGRLNALMAGAPDLLEGEAPGNLAFAFPRYVGRDGPGGFAARLAREAGILVLPSTLWRSRLADPPADRVRIALGHAQNGVGIDAIGAYVHEASRAVA